MTKLFSAGGRLLLRHWPVLWFLAIAALHVAGVLQGWNNENLAGHEFRQAQTALSTYFIERDQDYSLAYPTPVLGKPWSVPFEFPLYEWTVAVLHHETGYPLVQSARLVSVVCFYLGLPPLWLLLGRVGVERSRRWIVLGLVLTCPVYVFYARAFLIETMALLFSLWFLQAFVAAAEDRSWRWLAVANVAGVAAGLVKVTTFAVVLIGAAAWVLALLWRRRTARREFPAAGLWVLAGVALPFAASVWWVHFADAVKAANPAAQFALSSALRDFNLGTVAERLDPELWSAQAGNLLRGVAGWPVLLLGAVALVWAKPHRGWAVAAVLVFVAPLLVFPVLYKIHDYYFVANAVFLAAAVGLSVAGLLAQPRARYCGWALLAAVPALQFFSYRNHYWCSQAPALSAGGHLEQALRAVTAEDDVLVIAGRDWNASVPYYSGRRALMFHGGANDAPLVERSFGALQGESVGALVLSGAERGNVMVRDAAVRWFRLDSRPLFSLEEDDVYVPADVRPSALDFLHTVPVATLRLPPKVAATDDPWRGRVVEVARLPMVVRRHFAAMNPEPVRAEAEFSFSSGQSDGATFFSVHPQTRLWFSPPGRRCRLDASYLIYDGAYAGKKPGEGTDGVRYLVAVVFADGSRKVLVDRLLDPIRREGDRGLQQLSCEWEAPAGSELLVEVTAGPAGNYAFDWAALGPCRIVALR